MEIWYKWSKASYLAGKIEPVEVEKSSPTYVHIDGRRLARETLDFDCYSPTFEQAKVLAMAHWLGKQDEFNRRHNANMAMAQEAYEKFAKVMSPIREKP